MTIISKNSNSQFCVHHIGGRAGSVSFPELPKFSADITHVIYDADESCIEQIEETWRGKNVKILPYCLADKSDSAEFRINYCPYTSSLYSMNTKFGNFYHKNGKYDYVYEFALKTQKIIAVETKTLDSLVENGIVQAPDFLSIDTQGAELSILKGATKCLSDTTVAVLVEINFAPLYEGAPLFGKLDEFLRSKDFLLVEIIPFNLGYKTIHENYRGKGIPLQGEALYLLRPSAVKGSINIDLSMKLDKLAFAACAFGYTELAYESLELSVKNVSVSKPRLFQSFLKELYKEIGRKSQLPPLWHEIYSFEESNNRFAILNKKPFFQRILENLKDNPLVLSLKIFNYIIFKVKSSLKKILSVLPIQFIIKPRHTAFEQFLIKNGFYLAASEIRKRKQSGL